MEIVLIGQTVEAGGGPDRAGGVCWIRQSELWDRTVRSLLRAGAGAIAFSYLVEFVDVVYLVRAGRNSQLAFWGAIESRIGVSG